MIHGARIKPGETVVDVGINRVERNGLTRLAGDVDHEGAAAHAGAITPVQGGVGAMTIACLLPYTVTACGRLVVVRSRKNSAQTPWTIPDL